ncbi:MAG: DUF3592 domain-containing protein [Chlorobiales bacterium]|nr:DUF3592 domain-containing protein [Chlorobiales bacterium]
MATLLDNTFIALIAGFGILSLLIVLVVDLSLVFLKKISYKKIPWWASGLVAAFGIIGLVLVFIEAKSLTELRQTMNLPTVPGQVLEVKVVKSRAFIPYISYRYRVAGKSYDTTVELYVPQYGSKETRMQSAQDVAARYKPGETIAVYYDPQNPTISRVEFGKMSWDLFIRLGVGIVLYSAALMFATDRVIRWGFGTKMKN